ncbi:hypothetical protein AgCh_011595 [Apium graveolens]
MISPLPSISQAFSLIKHDEKQKQGYHLSVPFIGNVKENSSFSKTGTSGVNSVNNKISSGQKPILKCTYCNKEGHIREFCFKLVGYPDEKKSKGKFPNQSTGFRSLPQPRNLNSQVDTGSNSNVAAYHVGTLQNGTSGQQPSSSPSLEQMQNQISHMNQMMILMMNKKASFSSPEEQMHSMAFNEHVPSQSSDASIIHHTSPFPIQSHQSSIFSPHSQSPTSIQPIPPSVESFVISPTQKSIVPPVRQSTRNVVCSNVVLEPQHYFQAVANPYWVEAMQKELHALEQNDTWILVTLPPGKKTIGYINNSSVPNLVCKLRKSIYGLKQASRCWFSKLATCLTEGGYIQSRCDSSMFTYNKDGVFVIAVVYVDHILLSGNNHDAIQSLKQLLDVSFTIKDLGNLKYYLGLEITRNSDGIFVTQQKFIQDLLASANMTNCKPLSVPIDPHLKLLDNLKSGQLISNPSVYRAWFEKLLYLNTCWPDIKFSVQMFSQFLQAPRVKHMAALTRVLRYLKWTAGHGLYFPANNLLTLRMFSDSDWA